MIWLLSFLPIWIFQAVATGLIVFGICVYLFVKHPVLPSFVPKLVGIAMIVIGIFVSGGLWTQREFVKEIQKAKEEIARIEKESAENTIKIEAEYKNKVVIIKEKGDVIIQKVPEYISKTSDAKCDVPNGFVVLHDSAVKNEISDTTREFNESSSGVELSAVAKTVTGNYTTCNEVREQLKSLQDWISVQEKLYNKP